MNPLSDNPTLWSVLCLIAIVVFPASAQVNLTEQPVPVEEAQEASGPVFDENAIVRSYSKQFKISGGDSATRGTVANLVERTKLRLLALTADDDEWSIPVAIRLIGKQGDQVGLRSTAIKLNHGESGYEIQILVSLSRGLEKQEFERAVISALIYGHALGSKDEVDLEVPLSVPVWCVEGLLEAISWRKKESDRKLYNALFSHGGLYKLDALFGVTEADFIKIDAASEAAFRVSSGALVMALLEQPNGGEGMRKFLAQVPAFDGEVPALLRQCFPSLNLSQTSLEKWWSLQMADKASAPLSEVMSVLNTDSRLTAALQLRFRDGEEQLKEIPVSEWEALEEIEPALKAHSVGMAQQELIVLSYRCFPSYRPLLREYQKLLKDMALGETDGLSQSLQELASQRQTMVSKAQRARDFLDWFEITRARETSGVFEDYLKLKAQLEARPNLRRDAVSEYLDRMDSLFSPKDP